MWGLYYCENECRNAEKCCQGLIYGEAAKYLSLFSQSCVFIFLYQPFFISMQCLVPLCLRQTVVVAVCSCTFPSFQGQLMNFKAQGIVYKVTLREYSSDYDN